MRKHRIGPIVALLFGASALSVVGLGLASRSDSPKAIAATAGPKLTTIGNFSKPLLVTQAPGDRSRLFVVEQGGQVRTIEDGVTRPEPFLDISAKVSGGFEQGLLGLAFAPDYATSGRLYVNYTDLAGTTRIVEYRRKDGNPGAADPATARTVLSQVQTESNHNGGHLAFGPDRLLYIGLGDGGSGNDPHGPRGNGQDLGTLLGKILRIDPRRQGSSNYTVPASNPFIGRRGAKPEIWAYGLRNPWRFSFDRTKGGLAIGDVGQGRLEEINWSPPPTRGKGANYGWRPWEGTKRNFPGESAVRAVFPVLEYAHGTSGCSVTGGYVIRDNRFRGTSLWGQYLYGDFCSGKVWRAALRSGKLAARNVGTIPGGFAQLTSFGEDLEGRIYLTSRSGRVARLDP
ncbi:MAG: PQQ-dependent sugar dehydrogenase [Actinomycetes bacterium]